MTIDISDQGSTNGGKKQNIIFLLGAGASVEAGIPDTYEFVELFEKDVASKNPQFCASLNEILKIRKEFNKKNSNENRVDVEQLLVTLEHLENKGDEILLDFYENKVFSNKVNPDHVSQLRELLQDFIRRKVIVKEEKKLGYLREFTKFLPSLEIFSVNYDTCIEQLSYLNNLKYTDGFDIYWDSEKLYGKGWDIKLFKMHGSVIWFESQTKEYLKIPVQTFIGDSETRLKLITGEDLTPLLIYPMQKWQYVEPLTELQLMFKRRLLDPDTKILVVVGYSFRDEYIVRMLWDAARINNNLQIMLVGPSAQQIFEKKLKYLDKEKTLSRIADRVVCLPYPFSTAICHLRNEYVPWLNLSVGIEANLRGQEKDGNKPDWTALLQRCIDCEFSTKAESTFEDRIGNSWLDPSSWSLDNVQERILMCMKALLHSLIAIDGLETKWLNRVNELTSFLDCDNLRVDNCTAEGFSLGFGLKKEIVTFSQVLQLVDSLTKEVDHKYELLGSKYGQKLDRFIQNRQILKDFRGYLNELRSPLKWVDYFRLGKDSDDQIKSAHAVFDSNPLQANLEKLREALLMSERKTLTGIFGGHSFSLKISNELMEKN